MRDEKIAENNNLTHSELEHQLINSLKNGEFCVFYRAIVDAERKILGMEALLRWSHPKEGLLTPGKFLSVAENSGLICPIGKWTIEQACNQLVVWKENPITSMWIMSVNVSTKQFEDADFISTVMDALEKSGANPSRLCIEIIGNSLFREMDISLVAKFCTLKNIGVRFALDNFGNGYSSLDYIRRLPFDQINTDAILVKNILNDKRDHYILLTIIALAKSLDVDVVVKGIELSKQLDYLRSTTCKGFQGDLFGHPDPLISLAIR